MASVVKWGGERWLDQILGVATGLTDITALADGRYAVTYGSLDAGGDSGVFSQIFNADGMKSGTAEALNSNTSGIQTWAAIAAFADGKFVVAWPGGLFDPVWVARVGTDGNRIGADFPLTEDFTDQWVPDVAVLTDGSFIVAYTDASWNIDNSSAPAVQRYSAAGVAIGSPFLVSPDGVVGIGNYNDTSDIAVAALSNGNYAVTWTQQKTNNATVHDIRGRVFEADGDAVGSEFTTTTTAATQKSSQVAALATGKFVVAWASDDGTVRAQRFTATGVAEGAEITVFSTAGHEGSAPSVATLKDGRFVVVWSDASGSGPTYDSHVKGAIYNADGTLSVSTFSVNTVTDGYANSPNVSVLADGRVVVEFSVAQSETDASVAGNHNGTYTQMFDPRLAAIDIDGSNTLGDQLYGTAYADTFDGLGGNDLLFGAAHNDTMRGGNGNDTVNGDAGNDSLYGGINDDRITGGAGLDRLYGDVGVDALYGGTENDTLSGGDGNDRLFGDAA